MSGGNFKCHDCHMTFGSLQLLQKHKSKFCVGGNIGDPDDLLLRKGLWSEGTPSPRSPTPEERKNEIQKKVKQLKSWKASRQKQRDVYNLEERMLLDKLEDTEKIMHYRSVRNKKRHSPRHHLSKSWDIQMIQKEYANLRKKELAALKGIGVASPLPTARSIQSDRSNRSKVYNLYDEYPRYNPNQDAAVRQLAENHGRQMEYLQVKNRDLEKQREDIRRRLAELGSKPRPKGDDSNLLAELRAQEERNQRALEDLRRQLYALNTQRVNVIEVEKSAPQAPQPVIHVQQPQAPAPAPQPEPKKSYVFPVYYGNSLVAEIAAMRQAYLTNGGNDPDVLAQMSQMQAEAQAIEDSLKKQPPVVKKEKKDMTGQLRFLELENERLHRELMLLQEQNVLAKKRTDREGRDHKDMNVKQKQHFSSNSGVREVDPLDRLDQLQARLKLFKDHNQLILNAANFSDNGQASAHKSTKRSKNVVPQLDLREITEDDGDDMHESVSQVEERLQREKNMYKPVKKKDKSHRYHKPRRDDKYSKKYLHNDHDHYQYHRRQKVQHHYNHQDKYENKQPIFDQQYQPSDKRETIHTFEYYVNQMPVDGNSNFHEDNSGHVEQTGFLPPINDGNVHYSDANQQLPPIKESYYPKNVRKSHSFVHREPSPKSFAGKSLRSEIIEGVRHTRRPRPKMMTLENTDREFLSYLKPHVTDNYLYSSVTGNDMPVQSMQNPLGNIVPTHAPQNESFLPSIVHPQGMADYTLPPQAHVYY